MSLERVGKEDQENRRGRGEKETRSVENRGGGVKEGGSRRKKREVYRVE